MKKKVILLGLSVMITLLSVGIFSGQEDLKRVNFTEETKRMETAETNKDITLKLSDAPVIDVVIGRQETDVEVNAIKEDLLKSLQEKGVDTARVNFIGIDSTASSYTQTSFDWQRDVNASIGNISIADNGASVTMVGNPRLAGKNAIWYMPDYEQDQTITVDYSINFGDSFNAAGMLLRVQRNGNNLEGYMVSFNNTWGGSGGLWKFTYGIGANGANMGKTLIAQLNINTSGTLTVKTTNTKIEISGGGLATPYVYKFANGSYGKFGNGFGFFSDHYSHGCNNIGQFNLRNIKLEVINYKQLPEIIREPQWRTDSIRTILNVTDNSLKGMDDEEYIIGLKTRLTNDDVKLIAWGTEANKSQLEDLINANGGMYTNNGDYANAIDQTAEYIKSLIGTDSAKDYMILGEAGRLEVNPLEYMTNTQTGKYPNGRWKIIHDNTFFENDIGIWKDTGRYLADLPTSFDKVGRYEVRFEDKLINPMYIYVHRRPVAIMNCIVNGNEVTLNSDNSYDLDTLSNNKGIAEVEWSYKKLDDADWTIGQLSHMESDINYLVRLRVKDFQNTWSKDAVKYISTKSSTPIAEFTVVKDVITEYENLEIVDTSYDPAGRSIIRHNWQVYKDNTLVYEGEELPTNYKEYGSGNYRVKLKVTNSDNVTSEEFIKSFTVNPDNIAPEIVATPAQENQIHENIHVKLQITDQGGSEYKNFTYAITEEKGEEISTWSRFSSSAEKTIDITEKGNNYLHVKAYDNAGNERVEVFGPYVIEEEKVDIGIEVTEKDNEAVKIANHLVSILEKRVNPQEDDKLIDLETNIDGKAEGKIDIMRKQGDYTYTLKEVTVPTGHKALRDANIIVGYEQGKIVKVESSNPQVEVTAFDEKSIQVKVLYEREELPTYKVVVEAIDANDEQNKLQEASFKLEIVADSGENISATVRTNQDGEGILNSITGDGYIAIRVTQDGGASGYKKEKEALQLIVKRNANTGNMELVNEPTNQNVQILVNDETQEIRIKVVNWKKEEKNAIRIVMKNKEGATISGEKFTIQQPNGLEDMEGITNEEGILEFIDIVYPGEGDYLYTIIPNENNVGTAKEAKIKVTYQNGNIVAIEELSDVIEKEEYLKEENDETVKYVAQVEYKEGIKEEHIIEQKLKIQKTNTAGDKLAGVTYKITIKSGSTIKSVITQTDSLGEITADIVNADQVEITIKELKTLTGYVLDKTEKKIVLQKNSIGKMEIVQGQSVNNAGIESSTGNIVIKEINEKKIAQPKKANICFFLKNVDVNGNLLGNIELSLKEDKTGVQHYITTDSNGYVELHDFAVPSDGEYNFTINQVVNTKNGYVDIGQPVKLQIIYEDIQDEMKTSAIIVTKGYKSIEYKRCDEYETDDYFQLDVNMTLIQDGEFIYNLFQFEKYGELDEITNSAPRLYGTQFDVKVTFEDGTTDTMSGTAGDVNSFLNDLSRDDSKMKIEITETQAQFGYKLDEKTYVIEMKLKDEVPEIINGDGIATVEDERVKIKMYNEESQFTFQKYGELDEETNYIPTLYSTQFDVKVTLPDGSIMTKSGYTQEIRRFLDAIVIKDGKAKIEITETKSQFGYQLDDTTYTIEVEFTDEIPQMINGGGIATVEDERVKIEMYNKESQFTFEKFGEPDRKEEPAEILENTEFDVKVTLPDGSVKTGSGNTQAIREFIDSIVVKEGKAKIEITETKAEPGYELDNKTYVVEVEFVNEIPQMIKDDGIAKIEDKKVHIEMQNMQDIDVFFTFEKYGEASNTQSSRPKLANTEFDVKVTLPDGSVKTGKGNTLAIKNFFKDLTVTQEGRFRIEIKETYAEDGYLLDNRTYVIEAEIKDKVLSLVRNDDGIACVTDNSKQRKNEDTNGK